ncbi:MAG: hypothetical protein DME18_04720 [Verrucomicrobia bacterium]|nr:MAG: hypothetical protein DME18_04720 [Verrucomicrobiota bacterium]
MNSKRTFYLTVLALGVFAYIFFFERHTLDTQQRAERKMKLFPDFDAAKVTSVDIFLRSNGVIHVDQVIHIDRTNDQWWLTRPNYPAQSTVIENWLDLFHSLNRRAYISAEELLAQSGGLAAFGLEEPQATAIIQQGQKKLRLRLGAKTQIGEMLYLQQVGSDGVYVTESALLDRLPASATDWRDPMFLNLSGLKFDRLQVRAGTREGQRWFNVERDPSNHLWRLTDPRPARADNSLLQQLLQKLQNARVGQFVSDSPGSDLEPYGLQTPEVMLAFGRGTNNVLTVGFGRSPTNNPGQVYAWRSNYPMIVTVPRLLADELRAPYTDFLDKRLIEFAPTAVNRIEVRAAEAFALEKQGNGTWRIVHPFNAPADPALVQGFFKRLNSLQIVDLVKEVVTAEDLPSYGLSPPKRQYALKGPDAGGTNQLIARIDFGTNKEDKVFVRRSDENSVYTTRLEEKEDLPLPVAAFELRDRRVWNFTTNQVAGVTIEFKGKTYKLQRNGDGIWRFAEGSQGIVNAFALEEAMFRLGQLWSRAWIARGNVDPARYGFTDPPHKLSIDVNHGDKIQTLTLEFGGPSISGGPYALVDLDAERTLFECPFKIYNAYSEVVRSLIGSVGAAP